MGSEYAFPRVFSALHRIEAPLILDVIGVLILNSFHSPFVESYNMIDSP